MAGDGVPAATDRLRDLQVQLGRNEGGEGHAEGAGRLGLQLLDAADRTVGDRLGGAAVGDDRGGPIAAQEPLQVMAEAPQGRRVTHIGSGR